MTKRVDQSLYKIGGLAKKLNKTTRTLRFYEEIGLLTPKKRTEAGYRLYDDGALLQVSWIDTLQALGFSLPEIRVFLKEFDQAQQAPEKMKKIQEFYDDRLSETQKTIDKLQHLVTELKSSLSALKNCAQCTLELEGSSCRSCISQSMINTIPSLLKPVLYRIEQPIHK